MAKGGKVETLVVQSKVKQLVKKNKMNCASDVATGLSHLINDAVSRGVARAKSNGRKTLRAADL